MQTYEDLVGATGSRINYRAERFEARQIFSAGIVSCRLDGRPVTIENVSMTGLSVIDRERQDWSLGDQPAKPRGGGQEGSAQRAESLPVAEPALHALEVRVGEKVAYAGPVRLQRLETTPHGERLALALHSSYLDIAEMVRLHDDAVFDSEVAGYSQAQIEAVPAAYREFCAEVVHFLRSYKQILGNFEQRLAARGPVTDAQREEALARCEEKALADWRALWLRGNELVAPYSGRSPETRAIKTFTERVVTPELLDGPIWARSYLKPLGYPGDFEVMKMIYQWRREGDGAFARLLHRIGQVTAECVATRMVMVQQEIARLVAAKPEGEALNVTSLGCGPAQEVTNYLRAERRENKPITFNLIDQDERALNWAYTQTYPEVVRLEGSAQVRCLHVSFTQILKAWSILQDIGPQDLIYTVGLIDYLAERRARTLVASLYERLAPGGLLMVGNLSAVPFSCVWPMEFVCDWNVVFRSEDDMRRLVEGLDVDQVRVVPDETGQVFMLYARKRG